MRILAGIAALILGFWAYPWLNDNIVGWLTGFLTDQFPGMSDIMVMLLSWLPIIVFGLIIFAGISLMLNLGKKVIRG